MRCNHVAALVAHVAETVVSSRVVNVFACDHSARALRIWYLRLASFCLRQRVGPAFRRLRALMLVYCVGIILSYIGFSCVVIIGRLVYGVYPNYFQLPAWVCQVPPRCDCHHIHRHRRH